ncbi:MAG: hypothetical protein KatS3mg087_1437 [Patescibacteria group bacterium]|nr:MAG: hypothetical protein KatS3mg087_1437 [Patescibacteria group bacterium]
MLMKHVLPTSSPDNLQSSPSIVKKKSNTKGLVRSVDTIGTLTQGLVTYAVLVSPTEVFPDTVKPGMTAEVEIIVSP